MPTRFLHDCRRTAARNLIPASVPERVSMLLTGHKTRAIFDRYNIINEQETARGRRPARGVSGAARTGDTAWRAADRHGRPAHRAAPSPRATHHRVSARGGHRARRGWTRGSVPDMWPDSGRPRCAFVPELLIWLDRPDRTVVEARLRRRVPSTMRARGPHCPDLTTCPDANG